MGNQENKTESHIFSPQREKDILKLCQAVLDTSPKFYDNPNGPYENTCPFCGETEYTLSAGMEDIKHTADCAYLLAKDLSTGLL